MLVYLLSPAAMTLQMRCLRLTCLFFGAGLVVTYAEKLSQSQLYAEDGWMSWRVLSFDRASQGGMFRQEAVARTLFGRTGTSAGLLLGLGGVVLVWVTAPRSGAFTAGLLAIALSCVHVHLRTSYAGDGSLQMNLLIGMSMLLGFNCWVTPLTGTVCLLFIAAQSMLSYLVSGAAKLFSPVWMRGDALRMIMATTAFGSELGYQLASYRPGLTKWLCRVTVILEVVFPLLVFGPKWLLVGLLVWGATFHLANAVLMGLNTFVWSYIATYPAICLTWALVHHAQR